MKRYKDDTSGLSFDYPIGWELEKDANILLLYNPNDGLGVMQFSVYKVPEVNNIEISNELNEYLNSNGYENFSIEKNKNYAYSNLNKESTHWQFWLFSINSFLIFITYNCQLEVIDIEDNSILNIINSIDKNIQYES